MIKTFGLTHLALSVRDKERAYHFYHHVFGMEEYYRDATSIQAKTPRCHDVIAFQEDEPKPGVSAGVMHFGFRLRSPDDIDAAIDAVLEAGGTLRSRGEFVPGVPYAFVSDPDGYEVEIWFE
jgi:catechol 2,3-dioxygenase-like lactoylglutathione lyase family enzyme